jgi:hypothetical protein
VTAKVVVRAAAMAAATRAVATAMATVVAREVATAAAREAAMVVVEWEDAAEAAVRGVEEKVAVRAAGGGAAAACVAMVRAAERRHQHTHCARSLRPTIHSRHRSVSACRSCTGEMT